MREKLKTLILTSAMIPLEQIESSRKKYEKTNHNKQAIDLVPLE